METLLRDIRYGIRSLTKRPGFTAVTIITLALGVSANYFDVLGVRPSTGFAFTRDDERPGAQQVAVISYALWNRRFGGDPSVLQKTIALNGRTFSVIGVAPRTFSGLVRGMRADVW